VWFILIRSWVYSQLFVNLEKPYWLAQQQYFWVIGHAPNRSTFLPSCKMKTKAHPSMSSFYYMYGELNSGQTIWDKTQVLLETLWEHFGNKGKKQKNPCTPTLKRQKTGSFMMACWAFPLVSWNFYFQNCSSPFLARANDRGRNLGYMLLSLNGQDENPSPTNP
jgi:hypothetical protein